MTEILASDRTIQTDKMIKVGVPAIANIVFADPTNDIEVEYGAEEEQVRFRLPRIVDITLDNGSIVHGGRSRFVECRSGRDIEQRNQLKREVNSGAALGLSYAKRSQVSYDKYIRRRRVK